MSEKRVLPNWLKLKCNEKLVWNPSSLFAQCVAVILNNTTVDGECELEELENYCIAGRATSEPIKVIYKGECTVLGCWAGKYFDNCLHHHIERLGNYKFWSKQCRNSRRCIVGALPYHQDTTILNEIHERKRTRRILETKQYSCKRRLFE